MMSEPCTASAIPNEASKSASPDFHGRISLQNGFVLHRRDYRESSLLLDVFTLDFGRIRLLAKGVRKSKKGLLSLLQPFVELRLSWAGKGELPVLTAVESIGTSIELSRLKVFCGFYMNELLLNFLPSHDPYPEVFHLYRNTLGQLATTDGVERILRLFEVSLLEETGYGLSFDRETAYGQQIDPARTYVYKIEQGPVENDEGVADSISGATLLALKQKTLNDPDELQEAKHLMRRVINYYLNGKALKSRDFFKQIIKSKP
ncbi:DNA repair protein RecO [Methylocaldum sp.]|uniref:DNA repair protein RecO n=1 Tax=Methylocaldum sp. TaxID=1969727 RepID=UPI002D7612CB|nr:DNA repair protein RecO [Methylocaldum sp.]HYE36544.1 DNA repair protein RecO [Methylocaldum sp.]